jgi:flagellar hook-associated protein 3 FlgL
LNTVVTLLQKASTLGVEGASTGTMNQNDLNSIATEVQGIGSEMLSLANTTYAGQYIFAGTKTSAPPYVADPTTGDISYVGNDQQNQVQIGTGLSVAATLPGSSLFSQTGANVFTALQSMVTALQAGDSTGISDAVTQVSAALTAVDNARTFYGNTVNELTSNESYLSQEKVNIAAYQNTLVGADPAAAVTAVQQTEYDYNATLAATAKMDQVSLLDYLK